MLFLLAAIKCVASSHLWSGIWLRSKTVPVRTVNLFRQSLHRNIPACVLPPILWTLSEPQSGHDTSSGQRSASMWAVAAASSRKIGLVRLMSMVGMFRMADEKRSMPSWTAGARGFGGGVGGLNAASEKI